MPTTAALRTRTRHAGSTTAVRSCRKLVPIFKLTVALLSFSLLLPTTLGGRTSYTVVSGRSMEPTYHTNDLAITYQGGSARVGDVIVYRVPDDQPGAGGHVIHRVVGGDGAAGYITKGDNREEPDTWRPRKADVVGTVVTLVPQGGRVLMMAFNMANLGIVALGFLAWAVWPRKEERSGDDTTGGGAAAPVGQASA